MIAKSEEAEVKHIKKTPEQIFALLSNFKVWFSTIDVLDVVLSYAFNIDFLFLYSFTGESVFLNGLP